MNCKKCGNVLDSNAKFCNACGEPVTVESNVGVVQAQVPPVQPTVQNVVQPVQQVEQPVVNQAPVQQVPPVQSVPAKKKNNTAFIIIVVVLVVIVMALLGVVLLTGGLTYLFKTTGGEVTRVTTESVITSTSTTTTTKVITTTAAPIANNTIKYDGLTFAIPNGFIAQVNEDALYFINKSINAAIETYVTSGSSSDFALNAEAMKKRFENNGYTNVSYTISSYSNVDYLLYKFTYNNRSFGCMFADTKKGYILQGFFYYLDIVGENRYFDYFTEITKSVQSSTSNFAGGIPKLEESSIPKLNDVNFE